MVFHADVMRTLQFSISSPSYCVSVSSLHAESLNLMVTMPEPPMTRAGGPDGGEDRRERRTDYGGGPA